jgi:hypothetical protein
MQEQRGDFLCKVGESISKYICAIVRREDLSCKYVFENMDADLLKTNLRTLPAFIEFCKIG